MEKERRAQQMKDGVEDANALADFLVCRQDQFFRDCAPKLASLSIRLDVDDLGNITNVEVLDSNNPRIAKCLRSQLQAIRTPTRASRESGTMTIRLTSGSKICTDDQKYPAWPFKEQRKNLDWTRAVMTKHLNTGIPLMRELTSRQLQLRLDCIPPDISPNIQLTVNQQGTVTKVDLLEPRDIQMGKCIEARLRGIRTETRATADSGIMITRMTRPASECLFRNTQNLCDKVLYPEAEHDKDAFMREVASMRYTLISECMPEHRTLSLRLKVNKQGIITASQLLDPLDESAQQCIQARLKGVRAYKELRDRTNTVDMFMTATNGDGLSHHDIQQAIMAHQGDVSRCLEEHKKRDPGSSRNDILMTWYIKKDGSTDNVAVATPEYANSAVGACLVSAIERWNFGAHIEDKRGPIQYPFRMRGQNPFWMHVSR